MTRESRGDAWAEEAEVKRDSLMLVEWFEDSRDRWMGALSILKHWKTGVKNGDMKDLHNRVWYVTSYSADVMLSSLLTFPSIKPQTKTFASTWVMKLTSYSKILSPILYLSDVSAIRSDHIVQEWQLLPPSHMFHNNHSPKRPDGPTVLWAFCVQIEIITNLFLTESHHMTSFWVWELWHPIKITFSWPQFG